MLYLSPAEQAVMLGAVGRLPRGDRPASSATHKTFRISPRSPAEVRAYPPIAESL